MKMKKVLSLIIALCMVMQILPVFASETEAVTDIADEGRTYIFNYDFEDDSIGDWQLGVNTATEGTYTYGVEPVDDVKALTLSTTEASDANLFLDFEDVTYAEGKRIVVETKIRQTGSTSNDRMYLKLNRPDAVIAGNEFGFNWYTLGVLRGNCYQITKANDHSSAEFSVAVDKYTAKMLVNATYSKDKPVTVKIEAPVGSEVFKDAVTITDLEDAVVETTNSIDETNTVVTLIPETALTEGNVYKVLFNSEVVAEDYNVIGNTIQYFTVKDGNYIFYDDFESGSMGGWVAGATTHASSDYTYGVETVDDVKAMYLATTVDTEAAAPNLFLDFNDVAYNSNKKIVVKTRIMQTGGSTAYDQFKLKLNRPNITNFGSGKNESGHNWYTLGVLRGDAYQTTKANDHTAGQNVAEVDTVNKWVDVEIVLDGINKKAYTTITVDGQSYGPVTSTTAEVTTAESATMGGAYEAAGADPVNGFDSFDSLTFIPRLNANELYVDYIYAYEMNELEVKADATYIYDKPITVNFSTGTGSALFKDAVKLYTEDGALIETTNTVNDDLNVVAMVPETNLTKGYVYEIKLDTTKLPSNYLLSGKTEFKFTATDKKYIFYNDFENNSVGDWQLGVNTATEGTYTYGVEAIDDVKALTLSTTKASDANLFLDFEDVTYKEGKRIVIETRIRQTGTTSNDRMYLKLNRPNKVIAGNEFGFNWYTLGVLRNNSYQITKANDHSSGQNVAEVDTANKWVDVEIVLDGIEKMAYTTVKIDGKSYGPIAGTLAEITKAESSTMGGAYEAAGADPTNGFTAFDSLTWYTPLSANTIYIDYMRAYEVDGVEENIKAELLDENGNTVTELTANTKVIPTFTVQPRFAEETSYQLISAVYVNGILDDIHMQPLTTTGEVYVDTTGWIFENTDAITVKAFIWNSLTGMMPVSTVAEASGEH